ncbi:uncharacterized protein LOC106669834 isoform X1 [Cimex lectularius]|uniref:Gustatory receptor n=1 Tax=Cimex lectularius TaxID=79782 RepID=A0A8I6SH34_CIMLE|nr:uncharacterized protein LOC106669834 isoform X1 [Cimex lectularius]
MNLILVTLVLIWPLLVLSEEQKDCVLLKLHERHKRQLKEIGKIIMRTPNCFAAVSQELQVRLPAYYRQFAALIVYLVLLSTHFSNFNILLLGTVSVNFRVAILMEMQQGKRQQGIRLHKVHQK